MTATKLYRAVPLASLHRSQGEVTISADTAMAAMEKAKAILGEATAFDLCEGTQTVLTYRPVQRWGTVGGYEGQR